MYKLVELPRDRYKIIDSYEHAVSYLYRNNQDEWVLEINDSILTLTEVKELVKLLESNP